jgi:tetratricopeptide (TPR) repeat protein
MGADPIVAKASIAALTTTINEDDHWRMLAEVIPALRTRRDQTIIDAYVRTAAMLPESATLLAGHGLLLIANDNPDGRSLLMQAAGARSGAPISRASAAVALARTLAEDGRVDEYVAAVRTALKLLQDGAVANHPAWEGLVGRVPRFEDLSLELGEVLLARGDAAGAAEVLKEGHARSKHHGMICERLAEAHFKIGQLGSALTVLDELAVHYRSTGQLEAMAGVLRQMSQLAPNNIKVKSRLIDAYLQRGFVAEARAELIQRADLEERSGLIKDAVSSLQRAADLSWTIGLAEETFTLYSRVIAMAPDDVGNRSSLVNFYLQMGRLSDAAEHQRAVVDIALRNNHKHEAIAALHQVIGLTPDDTTAYYQLADLLASMGEYGQAEKVYRRLVLMNPSDPIAQAKATSMASLRES